MSKKVRRDMRAKFTVQETGVSLNDIALRDGPFRMDDKVCVEISPTGILIRHATPSDKKAYLLGKNGRDGVTASARIGCRWIVDHLCDPDKMVHPCRVGDKYVVAPHPHFLQILLNPDRRCHRREEGSNGKAITAHPIERMRRDDPRLFDAISSTSPALREAYAAVPSSVGQRGRFVLVISEDQVKVIDGATVLILSREQMDMIGTRRSR